MNISQAANQVGLPAKTIRYYEEVGLVKPQRDVNGYRIFGPAQTHKLTFLARARALGFTIEDCRRLLGLWEDDTRASADVRKLAADHLAVIEAKIADLQAMQASLSDLVQRCAGNDRPDCPILHNLGGQI